MAHALSVPRRDSSRRLGPFGHPSFGNLRKPLGTGAGARPTREQWSSLYSKGFAGEKVSTEVRVLCEFDAFTTSALLARAWFQKFVYLKSPFPRHRADRPSGPEVVCSESLLSRDREGAVQGLSAYKRSRTYGTKH